MSRVGIIANPAAGKDIRRIVAQGRFVPNHEKVNILKRVLAGLDAVGVERVLFMPDTGALGSNALQGTTLRLSADFVQMPVFHEEADTSRAAKEMREARVECIVTLGGDGTNRAVAKECGDVPLVPISTGTNNVFPDMTDGTIAGLAAGVIATGVVDSADVTSRHTRLEVLIDGELRDIALVDLAVSTERFVGGRAVWDMTTLDELFLTRSESTNIGLSAIGAQLMRVAPDEQSGLRIILGPRRRQSSRDRRAWAGGDGRSRGLGCDRSRRSRGRNRPAPGYDSPGRRAHLQPSGGLASYRQTERGRAEGRRSRRGSIDSRSERKRPTSLPGVRRGRPLSLKEECDLVSSSEHSRKSAVLIVERCVRVSQEVHRTNIREICEMWAI